VSQAKTEGKAREPTPEEKNIIVDILAYFAAQKKYGYVDIIGNALDPLLAIDALRDAVRDFKSSCIDQQVPDEEVVCPRLNPWKIDEAVESVVDYIREVGENNRHEFLLLTRELAVKALARAPRFKRKKEPSEESQSG